MVSLLPSFSISILFLLTLGNYTEAGSYNEGVFAATCGLTGVDLDTSPTNPYPLPPISDDLASGIRVWENPTFGSITKISVEATPHAPYFTAAFSVSSKKYWISSNARTRHFVREQNSRDALRIITIHCSDASSTKYHLKIPLHDMTPPQFSESEYTFEVPLSPAANWDVGRPINEVQLHCLQVCDNAVELEDGVPLEFEVSSDLIGISAEPQWLLPFPPRYCYRVDLYLDENATLKKGQVLEVNVTARDQYNAGSCKVKIIVL